MKAYIGLGSNLGDRKGNIKKAVKMMGEHVVRISGIYETDPAEGAGGQKFMNAVAEIDTNLNPLKLLDFLENIEKQLGRHQAEKGSYKPRTIDLDILLYGDLKIDTERLTIPHPRMNKREYVMKPLMEVK